MRLRRVRGFVLLTGCCCGLAVATWAQDLKPTFPAAEWERVKPETVGYSSPKLDALRA